MTFDSSSHTQRPACLPWGNVALLLPADGVSFIIVTTLWVGGPGFDSPQRLKIRHFIQTGLGALPSAVQWVRWVPFLGISRLGYGTALSYPSSTEV
jgi:hypothetical protein